MCQLCDNTFFFSQKQRIQLNKQLGIDVTSLVEKALNQLYDDRSIDKATRDALFASHYEPLKQAVNEGFGVPPSASGEGPGVRFEYGTPNYEFLKQLQTNTAVFSAFKNHTAIKDMAALLKDETGNLRTRDQFKAEALKVDDKYRVTHLETEYDNAVRSARMAANWQRYQKNKKLFPNLRYMLTKAAKPDKNHLPYVGINLPVDDVFWSTHYPPNRWRCQCSVEPNDDNSTDLPDKLPPVPAEFAFNSGKTGQVFDLKNSEYIKSVPPKDQPALIRDAKKYVNKQAAAEIGYQTLYKTKNGATVEAHPLAFDAQDFNENVKEARVIANQGRNVKILPLTTDPQLRKLLLPSDAKGTHCPDFDIEGIGTIEMKSPKTLMGERSVDEVLKAAYKQCNQVAIIVPKDTDLEHLKTRLKGQLKTNFSKMNNILLKIADKWIVTTRDEIKKGEWKF